MLVMLHDGAMLMLKLYRSHYFQPMVVLVYRLTFE
jgi:hypothetical protein